MFASIPEHYIPKWLESPATHSYNFTICTLESSSRPISPSLKKLSFSLLQHKLILRLKLHVHYFGRPSPVLRVLSHLITNQCPLELRSIRSYSRLNEQLSLTGPL